MKKLLALFAVTALASAVMAQTPAPVAAMNVDAKPTMKSEAKSVMTVEGKSAGKKVTKKKTKKSAEKSSKKPAKKTV